MALTLTPHSPKQIMASIKTYIHDLAVDTDTNIKASLLAYNATAVEDATAYSEATGIIATHAIELSTVISALAKKINSTADHLQIILSVIKDKLADIRTATIGGYNQTAFDDADKMITDLTKLTMNLSKLTSNL